MDKILRFSEAMERDPAIEAWMGRRSSALVSLVRPWFERMRSLGGEVRECLHDGFPYVCLGDAPFAYVNVFSAHADAGFVYGAELSDPARLLEGTGRLGRHVKLRPGAPVDGAAMAALIEAAYRDIRQRAKTAIDGREP
jgi:hypothetical protein